MEAKGLVNNLRRYRLLADLTQEEMAKRIGVTRQTVIAMEKGNYLPSVLLALRSAKLFGCRVEDLYVVDEHG
jgi:putative transcriptional regulator